jgi:hypothetical protein
MPVARLVATLVLALGGAFLPGPADAVEIVDASQPPAFNCVLHAAHGDAPWVGARVTLTTIRR